MRCQSRLLFPGQNRSRKLSLRRDRLAETAARTGDQVRLTPSRRPPESGLPCCPAGRLPSLRRIRRKCPLHRGLAGPLPEFARAVQLGRPSATAGRTGRPGLNGVESDPWRDAGRRVRRHRPEGRDRKRLSFISSSNSCPVNSLNIPGAWKIQKPFGPKRKVQTGLGPVARTTAARCGANTSFAFPHKAGDSNVFFSSRFLSVPFRALVEWCLYDHRLPLYLLKLLYGGGQSTLNAWPLEGSELRFAIF